MKKNGLLKEDACDGTKWEGVVKTMTIQNPPTPLTGTIPDPRCDDDDYNTASKQVDHSDEFALQI